MDSLWNEEEAKAFSDDPKGMRTYTARLLGQNSNLVLHGGGNTSLKGQAENIWESEPGKNFTGSFILYPTFLHPREQFRLNQAISLAV